MVECDRCLVPFLVPEVGALNLDFLEDSLLNTHHPGASGAIVTKSDEQHPTSSNNRANLKSNI